MNLFNITLCEGFKREWSGQKCEKNGDFQPLRHNLTREILLDNNKESLMGFGLVVVTTSAKPEDKCHRFCL